MSTVCAINLSHETASWVTAQVVPGEPIRILRIQRTPRAALSASSALAHEATPSDSADDPASGTAASPPPLTNPVAIEEAFDEAVALIESPKTIYSFLELPFQDSKKIEQVAPFQLQDSLPFEIDSFVVDSLVVGSAPHGQFRIVSTLLPREEIAASLSACATLGADPRFVTTGAAALATLAQVQYPNQTGLMAFAEFTPARISLAILRDGVPVHLRDFFANDTNGNPEGGSAPVGQIWGPAYKSVLQHIGCSIARVEQDCEEKLPALYILGSNEHRNALALSIPYSIELFELKQFVVNASAEEMRIEDVSWALGLFAERLRARKRRQERVLPDFRQGQFAYRRAWHTFLSAVQDEILYFVLAATLGVGFLAARIHSEYQALSQLDHRFAETISRALPGEAVPKRGELSYLQSRISDLEEQLQGLGSLTSLSPLDSLREIAVALGTGVDVSIDSLNISTKRVLIRGTVAENRMVGEVSTALKAHKERFCEVTVDPRGKTANNRVGFSAELKLCE